MNLIVIDNGKSGLFMCPDLDLDDQQVSWERHGQHGDQRRWHLCAIPSNTLIEALALPHWHCWLREAVVDDFGNLITLQREVAA